MLTPGAVTTNRKPTFSQVVAHGGRNEGVSIKPKSLSSLEKKIKAGGAKKVKVLVLEGFGEEDEDTTAGADAESGSIFPLSMIPNLVAHVLAYAEMLDSWKLMAQRAELLKCLRPEIIQQYIKSDGHVFVDVGKDRLGMYLLC